MPHTTLNHEHPPQRTESHSDSGLLWSCCVLLLSLVPQQSERHLIPILATLAGIHRDDLAGCLEFYERMSDQFPHADQAVVAFSLLIQRRFTEFAELLDLSSPPGKAVFWSGNQRIAQQYAATVRGTTLESTRGCRGINQWPWLKEKFPRWGDNSPEDQRLLWAALSKKFAENAKGPLVVAIRSHYRDGEIWRQYEEPVLLLNAIAIQFGLPLDCETNSCASTPNKAKPE